MDERILNGLVWQEVDALVKVLFFPTTANYRRDFACLGLAIHSPRTRCVGLGLARVAGGRGCSKMIRRGKEKEPSVWPLKNGGVETVWSPERRHIVLLFPEEITAPESTRRPLAEPKQALHLL